MATPNLTATLPRISRHAIWNYEYGLVVSPFSRILPESIADRVKPSQTKDYDRPRVLDDSSIYLAFYPKKFSTSTLFTPLALTPDELLDRIVHLPGETDYLLRKDTMDAWIDIEDTLIDIISTLMDRHWQKNDFPEIAWPRWPQHEGYRDSHPDSHAAFRSAKRAKRAFVELSACATFAISLWLHDKEYMCFDRAWEVLRGRNVQPGYLDLLQNSVVCNLGAGFRPGAFLNPYLTCWRPFIGYFVRARVPIWFVWGFEDAYENTHCVDTRMKEFYLPPSEYIIASQKQVATFRVMELPETFSTPGGSASISNTSVTAQQHSEEVWSTAPPPPTGDPPVEANSGQRSGESWETFAERMKVRYAVHLRSEKPRQKQSRLSREENASKQSLSQTATVFLWEQDDHDKTFYRRTRVRKDDAPSTFADVEPHQRIYWGHANEWDLVPQLPAPPGVVVPDLYGSYHNDEDDDDVDYEGFASQPTLLGTNNGSGLSEACKRVMKAGAEFEADRTSGDETAEPFSATIPSLKRYLLIRHGFTCPTISCWNPSLHGQQGFSPDKFYRVARALLFSESQNTVSLEDAASFTHCFNTTVNPNTTYRSLTIDWDIPRDIRLNSWEVQLQFARKDHSVVYILRPHRKSEDDSPWFVALASATAVLLVYRQGWETMLEIGRGLLELGIPFHTVVESNKPPPKYKWDKKHTALGTRPRNYKATMWDYLAYLAQRKAILRSSAGRAAFLRGGLVGRMASELIPESEVLQGPFLCDDVVAYSGSTYYLDDGISDEELDCISGVYHVYADRTENIFTHVSWWPKHDTFTNSGCFSDQWTPDAEEFYTKRVADLNSNYTTYSASTWRDRLKRMKKQSDDFIKGSERFAYQLINNNRQLYSE